MSDTDAESPLDEESSDVFEGEQESIIADDEISLEIQEPKEEVLRRKRIRRLLELQLERKRLREELDDFTDLDEDSEEFDDDDEDEV